jgi:hypothetical protein
MGAAFARGPDGGAIAQHHQVALGWVETKMELFGRLESQIKSSWLRPVRRRRENALQAKDGRRNEFFWIEKFICAIGVE